MSSATLCALSDLEPDQCAHCRHKAGGPDPRIVEQLEDLGRGHKSHGGRALELAAGPDQIVARWMSTDTDECGLCGEPVHRGQLVGRDASWALVCTSCLPDTGGRGGGWQPYREPPGPEPVPVPIPDLIERLAHPRETS